MYKVDPFYDTTFFNIQLNTLASCILCSGMGMAKLSG